MVSSKKVTYWISFPMYTGSDHPTREGCEESYCAWRNEVESKIVRGETKKEAQKSADWMLADGISCDAYTEPVKVEIDLTISGAMNSFGRARIAIDTAYSVRCAEERAEEKAHHQPSSKEFYVRHNLWY